MKPGCLAQTIGLLLCVELGAAAPAVEAKSYRAERFDVHVAVERDGSVLVTETVEFRFDGGPFGRVFREIPTAGTDGIVEVTASIDGRALSRGDGPDQVEVSGDGAGVAAGRRVRIRWRLPELSDTAVETQVRYRVLGVSVPRADADHLRWTVLPREHDYRIASCVVTVTWPEDVRPLGPLALGGVRHARPVVVPDAVPGRVEARDIRKDGHFAVQLRFPSGSITAGTPAWLARGQEQRAAAVAYVLASAALAAGIIGLFVLLRMRAPGPPRVAVAHAVTAPPGSRPPALAGALRNNGSWGAPHLALATLVDLAQQGHVEIEEVAAGSRWSAPTFEVVRRSRQAPAHEHERVVLDGVFEGQAALNARVPLARAGKALTSHLGEFGRAVREELRRERLVDDERLALRRLLTRVAVAGVIVGAIAFAPVGLLLPRTGPAPMLIPGAIVLASLVGLAIGRSVTPLSDRGVLEAARWRGFDRSLRAAAKAGAGSTATPGQLTEWVGYATALGAGAVLAKYLKDRGAPLPAWLRSVSSDDGALLHVMTTSHLVGGGRRCGRRVERRALTRRLPASCRSRAGPQQSRHGASRLPSWHPRTPAFVARRFSTVPQRQRLGPHTISSFERRFREGARTRPGRSRDAALRHAPPRVVPPLPSRRAWRPPRECSAARCASCACWCPGPRRRPRREVRRSPRPSSW